jgi:hypothetical protein
MHYPGVSPLHLCGVWLLLRCPKTQLKQTAMRNSIGMRHVAMQESGLLRAAGHGLAHQGAGHRRHFRLHAREGPPLRLGAPHAGRSLCAPQRMPFSDEMLHGRLLPKLHLADP